MNTTKMLAPFLNIRPTKQAEDNRFKSQVIPKTDNMEKDIPFRSRILKYSPIKKIDKD